MIATNHGLFGTIVLSLLVLSWLVRGITTKKVDFYWYMIWNMLLASIPVLVVLALQNNGGETLVLDVVLSAILLLFLPNTFYLLTDFLHLNPNVLVNKRGNQANPSAVYVRGDPWYIVDSFLIFLSVVFATVVGGFVLHHYFKFLQLNYNTVLAPIMILVIFMSAIGLYIGRFARWNSWDAFIRPYEIFTDFINMLKTSKERNRILIVTSTVILYELFSWAAFSIFLV